MMKFSIALGVIALTAAPVFASSEALPQREPVSIRVSTSGLDLTKSSDQARLRSRVNQAIYAACNPSDPYAAGLTPDRQCRDEMAKGADETLERFVQQARETRTAAQF